MCVFAERIEAQFASRFDLGVNPFFSGRTFRVEVTFCPNHIAAVLFQR